VALTYHPLAANNFLFGVSNFFVLPLPPRWELVRGPFEPEVDRQAKRGDISWVQEGRAMYLLRHPGYRVIVELHIEVKPRSIPPRVRSTTMGWTRGYMEIGGHRAEYIMGEPRRGWWPRQRVGVLCTAFYCDALGRSISVDCIGEGAEAAHLQEILLALTQLQCH
jgi:hypothetical protein